MSCTGCLKRWLAMFQSSSQADPMPDDTAPPPG
jgi:hypothetical protein